MYKQFCRQKRVVSGESPSLQEDRMQKNTPSSSYFSSPRVQTLRVWFQQYPSLLFLVMPEGSEVHLSGFLLPLSFSFLLFRHSCLQSDTLTGFCKCALKAKVQLSCPEVEEQGKIRRQTKAKPIALRGFCGITWNQSVRSVCRRDAEHLHIAPMGVCASVRAHLWHECTECL